MNEEAASGFPVRTFRQGSFIFHQGGPSSFGGIISSGRVAVLKEVEGEEIILATLTRGAIVGEMALVSDMARTASVVAMEDTELVIVERVKFKEAIAASPVLIQSLVSSLVERLAQTSERVRLQRRLPDLCLALANLLQACLDDNPADAQGQVGIPFERMVRYGRATLRSSPGDVEEIINSLALLDLLSVSQGEQGREIRLNKKVNVAERAAQMLGPQRETSVSRQPLSGLDLPQRRQGERYMGVYDLAAQMNTTPQMLCRMLARGEMPETMVRFPRQEAMRWAQGLRLPAEVLAQDSDQGVEEDVATVLDRLLQEYSLLLARALVVMDEENLLVLLASASPSARLILWESLEAETAKRLRQSLGQTSGAGPARFGGAVAVLRACVLRVKAE